MKIVSWNLFYRTGAGAEDIHALIEQEKPDLFLMQEATTAIDGLTGLVGGVFYKEPWIGKTYSLAAWVPDGHVNARPLVLPHSRIPGTFPPRVAQLLEFDGMTIANVHLSHGQMLNRRQLRTVAQAVEGPLAIIGDFNAFGPVVIRGFEDVGPRRSTHYAQRMVPLRLDRCIVRGLSCTSAATLKPGPSDHRPIVMKLAPGDAASGTRKRERGLKLLRRAVN